MREWRPPVGSRVLLTGEHPFSGRVGTVVAHETWMGSPSMRVDLDGGHSAGVLGDDSFELVR